MIRYSMRLICDGCGDVLEDALDVKVTKIPSLRWEWKRKWTDHLEFVRVVSCTGLMGSPGYKKGKVEGKTVPGTGVLEIERPYRASLHYCARCADGR
jgi:hypothetical protein